MWFVIKSIEFTFLFYVKCLTIKVPCIEKLLNILCKLFINLFLYDIMNPEMNKDFENIKKKKKKTNVSKFSNINIFI